MEIINYAPVAIPTLNRYEHFKRCLESLERCTGADKTEVYVALDFPPSEKYVKGWKQIDSYLAEKEKNNRFKCLHVIRREKNCGVGHSSSNNALLTKEIRESYEFYISTEDDNEFSPNFLEYINKCLNRFKDDERFLRVCGYNFVVDFPEMYKNNFYISKESCSWGTGSWSKKQDELTKFYDLELLKNLLVDDSTFKLLKSRNPSCISLIHSMLKANKTHGDAIINIYCTIEDKYLVLPTVSKVRNFGNDGSGIHSLRAEITKNKFYSEQLIDESDTFEFTDDIFTYEPLYMRNKNYKAPNSLRSIYKSLVCKLDIWLLRTFNYMPKSKYI